MDDRQAKRQKAQGVRVPMDEVMKELGLVKWPPKNEDDECPCGCTIKDGVCVFCEEHRPYPA